MEPGNTQLRHTLIYGLIIGGTMAITKFLIFYFGLLNDKTLQSIVGIILIFGVFVVVRHYRDIVLNGLINFGKAFTVGLLACTYSGLVYCTYRFFEFKYLAPYLIGEMIAEQEEVLLKLGFNEELVTLQIQTMQKLLSPGTLAFGSVFGIVFWGAILSLIVAAIMKRSQNPLLTD